MAVFVDFGFYFEFKSRLNYLVFDYIEDYDTIFETVITVYPFNFIFIILLLLLLPTIYFLRKKLFLNAETSTLSQIISGNIIIVGEYYHFDKYSYHKSYLFEMCVITRLFSF